MILNYFNNPTVLVIVSIIMVMALIFHNMVQAFVAARLGDQSPRLAGFMSFDPQRQLEPMGVGFLLLLGFGWPRSIPTNSRNYGNRGRSEAWVWMSGIATYLAVGFVCLLIAALFRGLDKVQLFQAFQVAASTAVLHAVINLFPILPLDMGRAAIAWGNPDVRRFVMQIAQFGILGFMVFFLVLNFTGVTSGLMRIFLQIFATVIGWIPGL